MISICETMMLICFGLSWPMNLTKAYKARTTRGSSLPFILLITLGYLCGITAKLLTGKINYVFVAYIINLLIVLLNIAVYFRNLAIDKRTASGNFDNDAGEPVGITLKTISSGEGIKMSLDRNEINQYHTLNEITTGNGIVIFGGTDDRAIPANELKQAFGIEEAIFNRSLTGLKICDAKVAFDVCISELIPESILIHIGAEDLDTFTENTAVFDSEYASLIFHIRDYAPKCRIGIVTVDNPHENETIRTMNEHLSCIARSGKCDYCDINNMMWAPAEQQRLNSFIINTGFESPLNIKRPLFSIARMLFRYQRGSNISVAVQTSSESKEYHNITA